MIRVKHSTGSPHYAISEQISYVTVWNTPMSTKGGIRFYDGDLKLVSDFTLGAFDDEIVVYEYPHNDKAALTKLAEKLEEDIRAAILEALSQDPNREVFTIDLKDGQVKILKKGDFNRFSSLSEPSTELFTFDNPDPAIGFPKVYVHEKSQRILSSYGGVFPVLAKLSRIAFPTVVSTPT